MSNRSNRFTLETWKFKIKALRTKSPYKAGKMWGKSKILKEIKIKTKKYKVNMDMMTTAAAKPMKCWMTTWMMTPKEEPN